MKEKAETTQLETDGASESIGCRRQNVTIPYFGPIVALWKDRTKCPIDRHVELLSPQPQFSGTQKAQTRVAIQNNRTRYLSSVGNGNRNLEGVASGLRSRDSTHLLAIVKH